MPDSTAPTLSPGELASLLDRVHRTLSRRREEIDELNVFPVPDGDTGTNMVHTVRAVVDALDQGNPNGDLSRVISRSAMRGARGNSGVILSQVLRALADAVVEAGTLDADAFADMLERAKELSYGAVANPVEGTVLTAIAAAASSARSAADDGVELTAAAERVRDDVRDAVVATQDQLDELRDAGVVDAGARGFEVVVDAILAHLTGEDQDAGDGEADRPSPHIERGRQPVAQRESGSGEYRFEVQYLLDAGDGEDDDDVAADLRDKLRQLGDSIVVVSSGGLLSVHVHTNDVGAAIEAGIDLGRPSRIEVTYFAEQMNHRDGSAPGDDAEAADRAATGDGEEPGDPASELACVVVLPGGPLHDLAREHGATVVAGTSGELPSVDELLAAVPRARARQVVLLPGHRNVVPTATQARTLLDEEDGPSLVVIESATSAPAVLAALAVFDADGDADTVVEDMRHAAVECASGEVVAAIRDASTPIGDVSQGQLLAVADGDVVGVSDDALDALEQVADACGAREAEAIMLLVGADVDDDEADSARRRLEELAPDAEVEVVFGGQRPARYLLGVE